MEPFLKMLDSSVFHLFKPQTLRPNMQKQCGQKGKVFGRVPDKLAVS